MEIKKIAELILHKWKVELKSKDRTKANIGNNFDELIDSWKSAEVPVDMASDLMKQAVKEHFPIRGVAKAVYRRNKKMLRDTSEDEYIANWCEMIESEAYQVFYLYYPIDVPKKQVVSYGSMSKQEHMRQMAYANTHPDINIRKLIEKRNTIMTDDAQVEDYDESMVMVDLESL